ncbi:MAG: uroporphyrinogen III methyltransferase / synthase [Puniceicoccaceae bacterium 5H]|nr:MAG: uroporphyrinogen III methyltransferase / synthase [Puniceicoccaceae bacterium 5H]
MINPQPLRGRRIVVTRHAEGNGRLAARLEELGAETLELPLIQIESDVDRLTAGDIFREIGHYEWIVFTSANGVRYFFETFFEAFEDIRSLGIMRIAAVGEGTARKIRELHLKVDLIPEEANGDSLAKALADEQTLDNLRVLVITGNRNREDLVQKLNEERAIVDTFQVYKTELTDLQDHPAAARFRAEGADALIFASSSAVKSFGEQAQYLKLASGAKVPQLCSFGPVTSQTMRQAGIPVALEAEESSLDGMVQALVEHFTSGN